MKEYIFNYSLHKKLVQVIFIDLHEYKNYLTANNSWFACFNLSFSSFSSSNWYQEDARMMSELVVVITGPLMGLNIINYMVMMKGEDFERLVSCFLKQILYLSFHFCELPVTECYDS